MSLEQGQRILKCLQTAVDSNRENSRAAEAQLLLEAEQPGYGLVLTRIALATNDVAPDLRLVAAVLLKQYVKQVRRTCGCCFPVGCSHTYCSPHDTALRCRCSALALLRHIASLWYGQSRSKCFYSCAWHDAAAYCSVFTDRCSTGWRVNAALLRQRPQNKKSSRSVQHCQLACKTQTQRYGQQLGW